MGSPTQRSLKLLRDEGWTAEVVERWNPHARRRVDLFGFADIICMAPGTKPMLVQTTSASGFSARMTKVKAEPLSAIALRSGFVIAVHGWRKPTKTIRKWRCRIELLEEHHVNARLDGGDANARTDSAAEADADLPR